MRPVKENITSGSAVVESNGHKMKSLWDNHRRNFVCDDGDLSLPLLKVVVTVTTTFSKWNLQFFKQF